MDELIAAWAEISADADELAEPDLTLIYEVRDGRHFLVIERG